VKALTIATRESKLALWQANFIRSELERHHPGLEVRLLGMRTRGDHWLNAPLREIGGKGLFIKELEEALLSGEAQIAVHSMKDLPAAVPDGFVLAATGYRADVRDVIVGTQGGVDSLRRGAKVGTSSLRRQAQLLHQRPDLDIQPIRGNVDTRLNKLAQGEYEAIVLAAAGLNRLGITPAKFSNLDVGASLPAAGQGALGIECLASALEVQALLAPLNDTVVAACVHAERLVSLGLGADCSMPVAAYAVATDTGIHLRSLLASADGKQVIRAEATLREPDAVAAEVIERLNAQGARSILDGLQHALPDTE